MPSYIPLATNVSATQPLFAPLGSGGGPGQTVSSFTTASISSLNVSSINNDVHVTGNLTSQSGSFNGAVTSTFNASSIDMPVVINVGNNFVAEEFLNVQQVVGYSYSPQLFPIDVPKMPVFQLFQSGNGGNATLGGDIGMGGIYLFGATNSYTKNSFITHNSTTSTLVITNATTGVNISSPVLSLNSNTLISYGTASTITVAQLISSVQGHS